MLSVNGYYDGHNYITEDNIAVKPNQQVIITFLDKDFEDENKMQKNREESATKTQQKIDALNSIFGILTPEESEAVEQSISDGIKFRETQI